MKKREKEMNYIKTKKHCCYSAKAKLLLGCGSAYSNGTKHPGPMPDLVHMDEK